MFYLRDNLTGKKESVKEKLKRRLLLMPIGHLLIRVCDSQQQIFTEVRTDQLQANR